MEYEKLLYFMMEYLEKFGICMQCDYCEAVTVNKQVLCRIKGKTDLMIKCNYFKLRQLSTGTTGTTD
jgi:hypothetical protein